ncbi:MAG: dihydroorotase [Clostridiales bacterium]|jgi:dihydroorotase|nr:dihydroorotase [Clostridiales bacterium]
MNILIKNGFVVGDGGVKKEDVCLSDGKRVKATAGIAFDKVIDAAGLYVMKGFLDMHVHLREPGFEYKEDIESGTRAAVKGGFSGVCCMPNTKPVCDNPAIVRFIVEKAKEVGVCKVYPIGAITKEQKGEELTEMYGLKRAGAVALSDDGQPVGSGNIMRLALEYAKTADILLICHEEDKEIAAGGVANEGYHATIAGLRGISPVAEEAMIARDILLAEHLDARVHIAHISTRGSMELIRAAKKRGVKVTCETCPHYFSATDELILSFDTATKVNPPLRTEEDRLAIIEGIKDGTVDIIVTDHAPHHTTDKFVEYNYAANGISGLETAFCLANTYLVRSGAIKIERLQELLCKNPHAILGIEENEGDITIVDINKKVKIDKKSFVSKGKNTPFDGWEVYGEVAATIVDGVVKYERGVSE